MLSKEDSKAFKIKMLEEEKGEQRIQKIN